MRSMGSYSGAEFDVEGNVAFELGEMLGTVTLLPLGIDYTFLLIRELVNFEIASGELFGFQEAGIDISVVIVQGNTENILAIQAVG